MKRYILSFIVIVIAISIPFLIIKPHERGAVNGEKRVSRAMLTDALTTAIRITEQNYYKPIEDSNGMFRGSIKGALASLNDPYTYYIEPREHQRAVENLYHAEFGGLGIRIYPDHRGFIKISKPIPNTPAALANLQVGDYITKVNDTRIHLTEKTGLTRDDVIDMLRGRVGTDVTITVQRKFLEPFEVTLTRGRVPIKSVKTTMLEGDIGYIQISGFIGRKKEGTEIEFKNALAAHKDAGMKALILDLRNNQGGLLNAAYRIADAFIAEGLIVSTRSETNSGFNEEYPATPDLLCPLEIPLVVLVNEYSASASEIVAGAIKDTRRGVLVGKKTYGKGVVQKRYELPDGGSLSVTISTYYTPNGTSINDVGITPQVAVDIEEPDAIEGIMLRKMDTTDSVENFVSEWIDEAHDTPGEMPQDFSLLAAELPKLQRILAEENIIIELPWLTERAERIFNLYVGIDQIVNLPYDKQLQEAMRIINDDEIEQHLKPLDEMTETPSTTQANVPPVEKVLTEE